MKSTHFSSAALMSHFAQSLFSVTAMTAEKDNIALHCFKKKRVSLFMKVTVNQFGVFGINLPITLIGNFIFPPLCLIIFENICY